MTNSSNEHDNPLRYPWSPPAHSGLMIDEQFVGFKTLRSPLGCSTLSCQEETLDVMLSASGLPVIADRHLVIAVGSNAAPAVMSRKLIAGTSLSMPVIPFVKAVVSNLAVGHAGYASVRGYIPATPYHSPGAETALWASYLDDDQIEILDDTEPNYHRVKLSAEDYPLTLENGSTPTEFWAYDSYRGVLTDRTGAPIPLTTQEDLHRILANIDSVAERFAQDPAVNMSKFNSSLGNTSIADLFKSAGMLMEAGIISQEMVRVGRQGPSNAELEELEEMLAEEDEILSRLMGDEGKATGPLLKWYDGP